MRFGDFLSHCDEYADVRLYLVTRRDNPLDADFELVSEDDWCKYYNIHVFDFIVHRSCVDAYIDLKL